jgi:hypothetical protein
MEDSQHYDRVLNQLMKEMPKINDAAKNLLAEEIAKATVVDTQIGSTELLQGIQKVLKAIRSVELVDPVEWGRRNPQKETESGIERMEEIMKYKASYALWKRVKASGESPAKLLGRTYLILVWNQVKAHVESQKDNPEVVGFIMTAFENSLNDPQREVDVVWTVNMSAAVATRHKERQVQALERARDAQAQQEELRNVIIEQLED